MDIPKRRIDLSPKNKFLTEKKKNNVANDIQFFEYQVLITLFCSKCSLLQKIFKIKFTTQYVQFYISEKQSEFKLVHVEHANYSINIWHLKKTMLKSALKQEKLKISQGGRKGYRLTVV